MKMYIEDVIQKLASGQMTESQLKDWLLDDWNKDVACRYRPLRSSSHEEKEAYYVVSGQIDWAEYHKSNRQAGVPVKQAVDHNDGVTYG